MVQNKDIDKVRNKVKDRYNKIAKDFNNQPNPLCIAREISAVMGYSEQELNSAPNSSNMGLGCGDPVAIASLKEGETVLDLGCGTGFDCFLAAKKVGRTGFVIGIDMSQEMLIKAREIAFEENYKNVEFREGTIENLPVDDESIDLILSNCVVNLSPDKNKVYKEIYRVLKPGGRIMISDIVLINQVPDFAQERFKNYTEVILIEEYLNIVKNAGLVNVTLEDQQSLPENFFQSNPAAMEMVNETKIPPEMIKMVGTFFLNTVKIKAFKPK